MDDLSPLVSGWPVDRVAVGLTGPDGVLGVGGSVNWQAPLTSVSKLFVGLVSLVALEEGTIDLAEEAGPTGATVEHLLAHASGLSFDSNRMLAVPGRRRIYSNTGIEEFARHLEARSGMTFDEYLDVGVLEPLGMTESKLDGSPAHGVHATVHDLLSLGRELLNPSLVSGDTVAAATTAHFPELPGVLPGIGAFDPNPWGLTFEIRGTKHPHWTGSRNSPATFGHFGRSGTFLWVDPVAGLAVAAVTNRDFGPWSMQSWPEFSDLVLARYA